MLDLSGHWYQFDFLSRGLFGFHRHELVFGFLPSSLPDLVFLLCVFLYFRVWVVSSKCSKNLNFKSKSGSDTSSVNLFISLWLKDKQRKKEMRYEFNKTRKTVRCTNECNCNHRQCTLHKYYKWSQRLALLHVTQQFWLYIVHESDVHYRATSLWNELQPALKVSPSVMNFKRLLRQKLFNDCFL